MTDTSDRAARLAELRETLHSFGYLGSPEAQELDDLANSALDIIAEMERENAHGRSLVARLNDFPSLRAYVASLEKDAELGAALRPHLLLVAEILEHYDAFDDRDDRAGDA